MSSFDVQQQAEAPNQQGGLDPLASGQTPSAVPALPPTALQMQMSAMSQQFEEGQQQRQAMGSQMGSMGAGMDTGGPTFIEPMTGGRDPGDRSGDYGRTGLRDMAEQLARNYGLNFGRGSLVDTEGNFLQTPDQLARLTGGAGDPGLGMSDVAAKMNYVAQAINERKIERRQNSAEAAINAGLGMVQDRGRGSLAGMMSGFYQQIAAIYRDPNLMPEQQDFSYWIQKEQMDEAIATREKEQEKSDAADSGGATGGSNQTSARNQRNPYSSIDPYAEAPYATNPTPEMTDFYREGKGDVVTTGPHAGQRPVYHYDPINKMTTVTWEAA